MESEPTAVLVIQPNIEKLFSALAIAQCAYGEAEKDKTGIADNGEYFYYPSKASLIKATRAALSENGLAVIQVTEFRDGHHWARTSLVHSSGASIHSVMKLGNMNDPRQLGETLSYLFRFAYRDITGVATDEHDLDGVAPKAGYKEPPKSGLGDYLVEQQEQSEVLHMASSWVGQISYEDAIANLESMYTVNPETAEEIKKIFSTEGDQQ